MIISNCPRCDEPFRVPDGELPGDAYARCPWCRDTFPLSDALKRLPPVLEVLSADGQPLVPAQQFAAAGLATAGMGANVPFEAPDVAAPMSAETVVEDGYEFQETLDIDVDRTDGGGTFDSDNEPIDFAVQDQGEAWGDDPTSSPVAPMKVSPAAGRRRNKSTGIRTVIGVVLGGLMSLPIAGGLLLAIGKAPDLGFWPFDGSGPAQRNAVAAPPADLSEDDGWRPKGEPLGQPSDLELTELDATAAIDPADAALELMKPQANEESPPRNEPGDGSPLSLPANTTAADDPANTDSSDAESIRMPDSNVRLVPIESEKDRSVASSNERPTSETDQPQSSAAATKTRPVSDPPKAADVAAADSPKPPAATASNSPPSEDPGEASESDEMISSAVLAGKMVDAMSAYEGPETERLRRLSKTYRQIAITCDLASGDGPSLRALASKIESSPILEDIESFVGSEWLKSTSRKATGIALVGRPGDGAKGPVITLASGNEVAVTNSTSLPSADKVLALGQIGEDGSSITLLLAQPLP